MDLFSLCKNPQLTFEMLKAVKDLNEFDIPNENNTTPLHFLCANPNFTLAMFRLVVDTKLKFYQKQAINEKTDKLQNTYLHYICMNPNVNSDILVYCSKLNWTNYNVLNTDYQTPYQLLCRHTDNPELRYLLHIAYRGLLFPRDGDLVPKYTYVGNDWIVRGITLEPFKMRKRLRLQSV